MNSRIDNIKQETAALRDKLINHPLYAGIDSLNKLQAFMQCHVFAVWDFMSLLKTLQLNLTCVSLPWVPVGSGTTRYLINEIVTGEESDEDAEGKRASHFEMYLEAMQQAEASTSCIDRFIALIKAGKGIDKALADAGVNEGVQAFVNNTFRTVMCGKVHVQAAVFTFGREDLIPGMFHGFVKQLKNKSGEQLTKLLYYLERHIEVDGDHHSLLGYQMTSELCGNDDTKWAEAMSAIKAALQSRLDLWDHIYSQISTKQ